MIRCPNCGSSEIVFVTGATVLFKLNEKGEVTVLTDYAEIIDHIECEHDYWCECQDCDKLFARNRLTEYTTEFPRIRDRNGREIKPGDLVKVGNTKKNNAEDNIGRVIWDRFYQLVNGAGKLLYDFSFFTEDMQEDLLEVIDSDGD